MEETYREALRAFLKQEVYPYVEEWEKNRTVPRQVFSALGTQGFFSPCFFPAHEAGKRRLSLRMSTFRILIEELAKTLCFGLTLTISVHVGVFIPLLLDVASEALKAQFVEQAIKGDIIGTVAATESDVAGSDFMSVQCSAIFEPERIVLDGHKHYITSAATADYAIVFARWRPGRHFANFCAVLLPTRATGVRLSPVEMAVMKTAAISHLEFHDVELPASYLLGRKELGMKYFFEHIAVERLSGGVWATAVAEQCLMETQHYAIGRYIGEDTLWQHGATRHRLAQEVIKVKMLQQMVDATLLKTDEQGYIDQFASAIIKAATAQTIETVISTCLQLHGAQGLETNSTLLRLLNEFRAFGIAGGSTETMLELIAQFWAQHTAQVLNTEAQKSTS